MARQLSWVRSAAAGQAMFSRSAAAGAAGRAKSSAKLLPGVPLLFHNVRAAAVATRCNSGYHSASALEQGGGGPTLGSEIAAVEHAHAHRSEAAAEPAWWVVRDQYWNDAEKMSRFGVGKSDDVPQPTQGNGYGSAGGGEGSGRAGSRARGDGRSSGSGSGHRGEGEGNPFRASYRHPAVVWVALGLNCGIYLYQGLFIQPYPERRDAFRRHFGISLMSVQVGVRA